MNALRTRRRKAFTIVELSAVTAAAAIGAAALMVALQPADDAAKKALENQKKDATQIRTITQGLILFASSNKDLYPLPSRLDAKDATVADKGRAKDTTANIHSILVYGGMVSTEILVSPVESNKSITVKQDYDFDRPKAAKKPADALWDPALSADFTAGKGNISYANQQPAGGRLPKWSNTFSTTEPNLGNRGPEIESVTAAEGGTLTPKFKNPKSNTFLIHGPKDSWEGNIAYNDGHVGYETAVVPAKLDAKNPWPAYTNKDKKTVADCLFLDEPDDAEGKNNFLGIFTKAGDKPADYKAIWD